MTLRVIGAGLGRTGTMSLKLALERLGFGPCYHMYEVVDHPEHDPVWLAATRGEAVDWDALFSGYNSGVDWPIAAFWPELSQHYPDAKFILTQREDAATWYRSFSATILPALQAPDEATSVHRQMTRSLILERTFNGKYEDQAYVMDTYLEHNQAVRDTLPPERLLSYRTGAGWEPICAFLGVAVPDEPFPHTNSTAQFQSRVKTRRDAREPAS
ncbi:MAG: sulfotransferase family protein [Gammaproteobacteria bacterium]|nr:sulfotransferase family protein [Gammaproteobacteria bacterium]